MTDIIKVFKNGKVMVRRGIVTATVDPRQKGMRRWNIEVRPPGRFKPIVGLAGYRVYYGPFTKFEPPNYAEGPKIDPKAIDEHDALALEGNATVEEKLTQARKMIDWHFAQEERWNNGGGCE